MKVNYSIIPIMLFCILGFGQSTITPSNLKTLTKKVEASERGERLKWMDSLTRYIRYDTDLNYDPLVKQTINFALKLDSLDLAGRHTANYIYYNNNVINNPKQGLTLFSDFIVSYKDKLKNNTLGQLYINGADSYYFTGKLDTSISYFRKAKIYGEKTSDIRLIGLSSLYVGFAESDKGMFSEASINFQSAIESFKTLKDTFNIIGSKIGLSILYSQVRFLKEAELERNEAIALAKQIKAYNSLVSLYFNAATDYRHLGNTQKRVDNIEAALALSDSFNIQLQTKHILLANLVVACVENNDLENAEGYYKEVLNYPDLNSNGKNKESFIEAKKFLLYKQGQLGEAANLGEDYLALRQARGQYAEVLQAYKFLNMVYFDMGNKEKAYDYLQRYAHLEDSIRNAESVKSLAFYQTLYETEKRDQKIKTQENAIELLHIKDEIKSQWLLFGTLGLLGTFGFVLLIRSKNKSKQTQLIQEQFSQDLLKSQEDERIRIAKDLHDSVGQQLTLIKQKSQNAHQEDISTLTHAVLEDIRAISRGLYPATLRQLGLSESIEQLVNDYDEETELFFSSDIDNINALLNADQSLNVYRCMQESFTNIIKHADATAVSLSIKKEQDAIHLTLIDNGKGFNVSSKDINTSLGLKTIKERVKMLKGKLIIDSKANAGTTLIFQIPVNI